jgi:hypothetical protein
MQYWVEVFKDDYLPHSKDEYDARDDKRALIERAIESLESELDDLIDDAIDEWFEAECEECDGTGECLECQGNAECSNIQLVGGEWIHPDNCDQCDGDGVCIGDHCENGKCDACEGTGLAHPQ